MLKHDILIEEEDDPCGINENEVDPTDYKEMNKYMVDIYLNDETITNATNDSNDYINSSEYNNITDSISNNSNEVYYDDHEDQE